jgi:chemotaxis protein CheC
MTMHATNDEVRLFLETTGIKGFEHAAEGFSGMLGEAITPSRPVTRLVPLAEIPNVLGGPEQEAVGIYLQSEGDLVAQFVLVLPFAKACELVDLILGNELGTTVELGSVERSALGEVGNVTTGYFLNRVASLMRWDARPTPPAVVVDMVGAILSIITATIASVSDEVLLLQGNFVRAGREVEVMFWIIPDAESVRLFTGGQEHHG